MLPNLKLHFRRFLEANPNRLHFAAHSHHFWPDVTYDAHMECWMDAARLADLKWDRVFGEILPDLSRGIARILNLPTADSLVFAPNTHEFVLRLLSCLPAGAKVLTTDAEFYSFRRQTQRMAEDGLLQVEQVPTQPFETFEARFKERAATGEFDLIFLSQVFFDSGFAVSDLAGIVSAVPNDAFIVIDGYHGFMAMPTDLSSIADRAFYLSGGYKYAMSGEGACFMHCPKGWGTRPLNTGWFAEMDSLAAEKSGKVDYAPGAERFFGATFDPSGIYRLRAVLNWLESSSISVSAIHDHVHRLHKIFVDNCKADIGRLLISAENPQHGHFLTYQTPGADELRKKLLQRNVVVDNRGERLRFGFSVYHDENDVSRLIEALS